MIVALAHNLRRSPREEESEFDTRETLDALAAPLAALGHTVVPVEVSCPLPQLVARLARARADVVFNLAEGRRGALREAFFPAVYAELGLPHTGSDGAALALALDKRLAKRVVADAGVATPPARLVRRARDLAALADAVASRELALPVIVKPCFEGSSKGITQASVVEHRARLVAVAAVALDHYPEGVLVEEYVEGTDVAVAWVDGLSPATGGLLPPIAYRYEPTGPRRIYDHALKHARTERVQVEAPARLDAATCARLTAAAGRAFDALGVCGYGRADFRVDARGEAHFLEMNPLPLLDDVFAAAAAIGVEPGDVLARILQSARPAQREVHRARRTA